MKKTLGLKYINQFVIADCKSHSNNLPTNIVKFNSYVENCSLCKLSTMKDSMLIGLGDVNSDIYIIGLNNDFKKPDIYNVIKDLIDVKLNRDINDFYMTNILKCIGNYNYDSLDTEINTCIKYLDKQIEVSQPKLILTIGKSYNYIMRTAQNHLDVSGSLFKYNGINLVPLLELDFINKNPSYKDKMFNDLKKIKNILENK